MLFKPFPVPHKTRNAQPVLLEAGKFNDKFIDLIKTRVENMLFQEENLFPILESCLLANVAKTLNNGVPRRHASQTELPNDASYESSYKQYRTQIDK